MSKTFLDTHVSDIPYEVGLSVFQSRFRRNSFESFQIGTVPNDEDVGRILGTSRDGKITVAVVGGNDDVAETISQFFKKNLSLI